MAGVGSPQGDALTCPACGHVAPPTVGDLINARARAGAARVEAEQTAERARAALKHAHGRDRIAAARETFAAASQRLTLAANAYEAARTAEAAGGDQ